jgi:hypothetical protein
MGGCGTEKLGCLLLFFAPLLSRSRVCGTRNEKPKIKALATNEERVDVERRESSAVRLCFCFLSDLLSCPV